LLKEEKYRRKNERRTPRNEEGLTPKQAELKELNSKVVELKEQGLSLRKIAEQLNITLGKVQRVLKK
jgi:DNA-binding CsgD family transcriptional regulator